MPPAGAEDLNHDIRVIVFDLGNVLIDIFPAQAMQSLAEHSGKPLKVLKASFLSGSHLQLMSGEISFDRFLQQYRQEHQFTLSDQQLTTIWNSVIGDLKPGIKEVILTLTENYRLAICSNTDPQHWLTAKNYFDGIEPCFTSVFLSYEMGKSKPDLRLFEEVLTELDESPESVFFVDDTLENVKAAASLGIRTHHFTTVEVFKQRLHQEGLL